MSGSIALGPRPMAATPLRVSVIIATYNGRAFVAETIAAVRRQTHLPVEIIVMDDSSTDGTPQAILAAFPDVRVERKARAGVAGARNAGAALARGDLLCFVDQDDIWYPDHLARQVKVFEAHPEVDVVVSPYLHWYPTSGRYPRPADMLPPPPVDEIDSGFTGWVHHQFMFDCWALTSATTIRRTAWLRHGGFDPRLPFAEDWDLWLRLAQDARFAKLNWPPVLYRQHPQQGSRIVRDVDYRTRLLDHAARRWGLRSRDGRELSRLRFRRQMSLYEANFGHDHLCHGSRRIGVRALFSAWLRNPLALRPLVLGLAGTLGWRPRARQVGAQAGAPGDEAS